MTKEVDFTKPLMFRNETPFTLMGTNFRGFYPVQGYSGDSQSMSVRYENGRNNLDGTDSPFDIVNVPEKLVKYVNVYTDSSNHNSRESADNRALGFRTACIRIEYTEGQFDE